MRSSRREAAIILSPSERRAVQSKRTTPKAEARKAAVLKKAHARAHALSKSLGRSVAVLGTKRKAVYESHAKVPTKRAKKNPNVACVTSPDKKSVACVSNPATDIRWARAAKAGDYLCRYDGDDDPGSRCGRSDAELGEIKAELRKRGLVLRADDKGLVARAVPVDE